MGGEWRHLTRNGQACWIWYRLRRLIVQPAPSADRCFMGSPVGEHVHCARRGQPGSLWCRRCDPGEDVPRRLSR
jgi:hypothetical protein